MKRMFQKKIWLSVAVGLLIGNALAHAETPEEKGYRIAEQSEMSDRGFGDSKSHLKMVLTNASGQASVRQLEILTLEVPDTAFGDKSMTVFDNPADIKGTALLSHAKILDPDDQWLYLPALKRIKRISSVNKSGPFVGSEFAFEDFTSTELGKYDYKFLREESCGEVEPSLNCDVIERFPKYEHSGYTRQIGWFDQEHFQLRKVDFYDRKNSLLKTLTLSDYRLYQDKFWRAHSLHMKNHQTNKQTTLEYTDYEFQTGLTDADFEKNVLKRIR